MISFSPSSRAMKLQSHAVRVFPFACTRWVVSSARTISSSATSSSRRSESGLVISAVRRKGSPRVESSTCTPTRRYAFAWRCSGNELVDLARDPFAELREVAAAALGADLLVLPDLVLDASRDELALLLCVLTSLLERGDPRRLGASRVADRLGHGRHLLGALTEDVTLQLLESALDRSELLARRGDGGVRLVELDLEVLRPIPPLAAMIVTA